MESMAYSGPIEVVTARFDYDENIVDGFSKVIEKHDIQNGVVVSGVATLKRCEMHYIEHTDFPPDDTKYTVEHPLEVGTINGLIADKEPHLHIVLGHKDKEVWVGHLEDDSIVGYLAEVCILKFNDLKMARYWHDDKKLKLLAAKKKN